MQMPIKRTIDRVPGGMMVVPLLVGRPDRDLLARHAQVLRLLHRRRCSRGALTILAVFYVCMGASIEFRATPYILKKGGTLLAVKIGIARACSAWSSGTCSAKRPSPSGMLRRASRRWPSWRPSTTPTAASTWR